MSDYIWEYLQSLTVLISDFTLTCLLAGIAPLIGHFTLTYSPWLWLLCLAAQLLIGLLMLHHGTSWTAYLLVQTAAIAAEAALACFMFSSSEYIPDLRMWFGAAAVIIGTHAAYAAYRRPSANLIVNYVDVTVLALLLYLYTEYAMGHTEAALWALGTLTIVFDLVVVDHLRTEAENGHRISGTTTLGKGILIALPLLFLVLTGAAVGFASGQIHSFVDLLLVAARRTWDVIAFVIGAIANVIAAVILFFAGLFSGTPRYIQDPAAAVIDDMPEFTEGSGAALPSWVIFLTLGIIIALIAGVALYALRNSHIRINAVHVKKHKAVRKSHLSSSILEYIKRAASWASFKWACLRNRKSVQGLYILAQRRGSRMKVKKKESESPSAYLRRLCGELQRGADVPQETDSALLTIAGLLDDIFYGGKTVRLEDDQYAQYARLIKKIP